jgi:hypothetical protein
MRHAMTFIASVLNSEAREREIVAFWAAASLTKKCPTSHLPQHRS